MDCQKKKVLQAGIDFVRENLPGQHSLPAGSVTPVLLPPSS